MSEFELKNSLAVHTFIYSTMKKIELKIKDIPEYQTKKYDKEVLKSACKFINDELEKAVNDDTNHVKLKAKEANKIDKSKLVIQALANVFELTDEETQELESSIDFFFNNKIVKDKKLRRSIIGKVVKGVNKIFFWKK